MSVHDLIHVFRADPTNVGDWYCPPGRYFPFGSRNACDILSVQSHDLPRRVILGGGCLMMPFFESHVRRVFEPTASGHRRIVIGWGVGQGMSADIENGFVAPYEGPPSPFIDDFDLLGIRDFGTQHCWVPCVSCMHPAFDVAYETVHDIGVFEHKRIPINIDYFPKSSNDGNDIESAVRFLASCRIIITNSYHGAYWATLLGKEVLAFPFNSKFYGLKHPPAFCEPQKWESNLDRVRAFPTALSECRAANINFYKQVSYLLNQEADPESYV
ncbi:polysaccharide pyruvyl transferase family protein [Azospirillum sp. B506]|uniref:polysaccharide pyruvyl transferase family protein n=1 Tax=Azospirillum sp. B506 TaxID=137721 RepID=UPI0011DDAA10|nr:polysaccharide pyruvyl transferase family protein [Azospirillum sp. B506]